VTIWFYIKTNDDPKTVGDVVCAYNIFEDSHPKGEYAWVMEKGTGPDDYWEMRAKFEDMKDLADVAIVYKAGDTVVLGEVDDDFVPDFIDPLLEKYGFENIKCITAAKKR